jgi:hypothetical protein
VKAKEKENLNLLIFIAGCLDPRYKLSLYTKITVEEIFGEERGQIVSEAINTCLHELFEEYMKMYASGEDTTVAEPPELFQLKCPSRPLKGNNTLKPE